MKLKWSLAELTKYQNDPLVINGTLDLTNSLKKRKQDLIDATPIHVEGIMRSESSDRFLVDLTLTVTLTLPSTRSLTPVEFDMTVPLTEVYLAPNLSQDTIEDSDNEMIVISLDKDILDLKKPIEDTIIASIPMKILSDEELVSGKRPEGEGWEITLEDERGETTSEESRDSLNNPFGVLKDMDLFSEEDEEE